MIGQLEWCKVCEDSAQITDQFEEQIGVEEQARRVTGIRLSCGHDVILNEAQVG